MAIEVQADGRFGRFLYEAMEKQGFDIKHVATEIESTYEHIRKLIKGMAYPSPHMVDKLAALLKFNAKDATSLVDQDKMQKKFKKTFHQLTGKNPELDPIEKDWGSLSADQKQAAVSMIQTWAKTNRQHVRK